MFPNEWNWIKLIDTVSITWIVITVLCAAYVAWDQYANNPEPVVMKWGFILVTLYTGPFGLLMYVLADKEPVKGQHESFIKPLWKQGVGSTIHCVAGDATGIIAAAIIVSLLGIPMWVDLLIEYVAGFLFGWFIFQSLFMKKMMGGSYIQNVRHTFFAEFISMNAMMAGMAPAMTYLMMGRDMRAMNPAEPLFWLVMSISISIGFITSYPLNVWMVKKAMKHGLMTVRDNKEQQHTDMHKHMNEKDQHAQHGHPTNQHQHHDQHTNQHQHHGQHGHSSHQMDHHSHDDSLAGRQHQTSDKETNTHHGSATKTQIAALSLFSFFILTVGLVMPNLFYNTEVSAHDVGDVIMPPGMVMDRTLTGDAMRDMRAVLPKQVSRKTQTDAQGNQPLVPRMEEGYKVFELEASVFQWNILANRTVDAYGFNNQVPGPLIRINEGDNVQIRVTNNLPEETAVHWHGLILDNNMDGAAEITQEPIQPGQTYTYQFTAVQSGMYFYHSHSKADRQQGLGLYGMLIVDPADQTKVPPHDVEAVIALQEWLVRDGLTYPAMMMEGAFPNYFTVNGKAYPDTASIKMKVGESALIRFIGSNNNFVHPMHIHGGPFEVVALDGEPLKESARYLADTVNVGPGQRYDVVWTARKPGKWLIHCHIPHHTTNNNVETEGGGGLMVILEVSE